MYFMQAIMELGMRHWLTNPFNEVIAPQKKTSFFKEAFFDLAEVSQAYPFSRFLGDVLGAKLHSLCLRHFVRTRSVDGGIRLNRRRRDQTVSKHEGFDFLTADIS